MQTTEESVKEEEEEGVCDDPYMRSTPDTSKKKMFSFDWSQGYISPYRATPENIMGKALVVVKDFLLLNSNMENVIYDLGCGDGRFVISAAKQLNLRGVGIDLDEKLIKEAEEKAEKEEVLSPHLASFKKEDITKSDLSSATIIILYLLPEALEKISGRLHETMQNAKLKLILSIKWPIKNNLIGACNWDTLCVNLQTGREDGFYIYKKQ